MSSAFENFSIPGQIPGLDGFVGQTDHSLNFDTWSETDGLYLPAEELDEFSPDAPSAVQRRAPDDGDGAQGGALPRPARLPYQTVSTGSWSARHLTQLNNAKQGVGVLKGRNNMVW
jgi:hypothetical protein